MKRKSDCAGGKSELQLSSVCDPVVDTKHYQRRDLLLYLCTAVDWINQSLILLVIGHGLFVTSMTLS